MLSLGIDPGLSGAAALLQCADHEGPEYIVDAIDLPTMEDNSKRQIDDFAFANWLNKIPAPDRVFIENVRAMPSFSKRTEGEKHEDRRTMGAASAFRFGLAAGQIRSTVRIALGLDPEFIEARAWKDWFALPGGDKESARQLALKIWPLSAYLMKRKKDHQRAEAMLIAKYGARPLIGKGF